MPTWINLNPLKTIIAALTALSVVGIIPVLIYGKFWVLPQIAAQRETLSAAINAVTPTSLNITTSPKIVTEYFRENSASVDNELAKEESIKKLRKEWQSENFKMKLAMQILQLYSQLNQTHGKKGRPIKPRFSIKDGVKN